MKKSKFLKKSLAMLLAVMLVVAMIPLSAAAAPQGVTSIYVDNNIVTLGNSMSVDVPANDTYVEIRTNEDWVGKNYQLRVKTKDSQWNEKAVTTANQPFDFDTYLQEDNTMTLVEYVKNGTGAWERTNTTYTLTVNKVKLNTTTNLDEDYFQNKTGVYSVDIDNENKIVNVVLARNTKLTDKNEASDPDQNSLNAQAILRTVDNATINNHGTSETVELNNGKEFTVTSQSGGNKATFKVVATYLDALSSMTVTGLDNEKYTAEPVDTNQDDIPDSFKVTMPDSAIYNEHDELTVDPKLGVGYEVEGDVSTAANAKVTVNSTTVKADGSVPVQFVDLDDAIKGQEVTYTVVVERLGATQHYNLTVELQKDNSTDITYAQVDRTIADWDVEAGTIVAEVPSATDLSEVSVTLRTPVTVEEVLLNSGKATTINEETTYTEWIFYDVDLTSSKIVTVEAEDGTLKQYTLSANKVENATDAAITAFYIGDYRANVTAGEDDIYVTVPYMTIDVADLPVYATPTSYSYVNYVGWGSGSATQEWQMINGTTTAGDIVGLGNTIPVGDEITGTIIAHNKNNPDISETYTIHVVLDEDKIATGNELTDLEFTAQSVTNDTDKDVVRAMTDENTFNNEVAQRTSGDKYVQTLNLKVPLSFTKSDLGITFRNVVTDFNTRNGGVAFVVTYSGAGGTGIGNWNVEPLKATTDAIEQPVSGEVISTGKQIIVLPEEIARKVLTSANGKSLDPNDVSSGTLYTIQIDADKGSSASVLNSMSVKDFDLQINPDYTISGTLPFSLTTEDVSDDTKDATFVEFSVSDYAVLTDVANGANVYYFSNGDQNGDGEADPSSGPSTGTYAGINYNYQLVFKRNLDPDQTVSVYRAQVDADGNVVRVSSSPIDALTVKAEDRLNNNGKVSSQKYTFKLTWAAPCEDADIETFTLGGYEGHINNDPEEGRTINVTVPYGTSVTGMIAEFTTSTGAKVEVGELGGMDFESGVTSLNYTNPVKLYVTSEDGDTTRMYTVTVTQGVTFDDIDENDWFYDDVVDAAENGYVNGMGEGKYQPYGQLTRAQFALMIARAMNYDSNPDVTSAFPDVADDHWAKAAINFCYQNDIIRGYEDGEFKPDRYVTRQEVAAILARAFNLEEISSEEYPDDASIASWASEDVYKAKAAGLMKGDADTGNFRPTSLLNRAEAATILMNANRNGYIN